MKNRIRLFAIALCITGSALAESSAVLTPQDVVALQLPDLCITSAAHHEASSKLRREAISAALFRATSIRTESRPISSPCEQIPRASRKSTSRCSLSQRATNSPWFLTFRGPMRPAFTSPTSRLNEPNAPLRGHARRRHRCVSERP